MTDHRIHTAVAHASLPFDEKKRLLATLSDADFTRKTTSKLHDWASLLRPVEAAIKSVASSAYRWRHDPAREPVYSAYLLTLRRTKQRIQQAMELNLGEKSIPEVAAEQKNPVPLDGLIWHAWVPPKVKSALLQAFDTLYRDTLPALGQSSGKRIIPFSTHIERSTTDARWLGLETRMLRQLELYASDAQMDREVEWLEAALDILRSRDITGKAVVQWHHLLPGWVQEQRNEWLKERGIV